MPTGNAVGPIPDERRSPPPRDGGASGYVFGVPNRRCPDCDDLLIQVPRRLIDRALSVFVCMHRYRCPNFLCAFEGNLRDLSPEIPEMLNSFGLASAIGRDRR
jgi:hypothetical protein